MQVLDLGAGALLRPMHQSQEQPVYSLQPKRLYAIQCLVENSRPRSQVTWFNRSSPIELATVELSERDFLVPNVSSLNWDPWRRRRRRLASFTRFIEHAATYR